LSVVPPFLKSNNSTEHIAIMIAKEYLPISSKIDH
jgi:hypothetical protein